MTEVEQGFMDRIGELLPDAGGYREHRHRSETDRMLREHIAEEIERLRGKMDQLKTAADEEGEEDMLEDLERIDSRMARTNDALRAADYSQTEFMRSEGISDDLLNRICGYDQELLDDLELLSRDVMELKYETIGNLTLREVEGTLAAIELKFSNRLYVLENTESD